MHTEQKKEMTISEATAADALTNELVNRSHEFGLPLDQKILGGIAIRGQLESVNFIVLENRINGFFDAHSQNTSKEFGACVAYAIGLNLHEACKLDDFLGKVASSHGGNVVQSSPDKTLEILWQDKIISPTFVLQRYIGPIVLDNNEIPEGRVYTMHGQLNRS